MHCAFFVLWWICCVWVLLVENTVCICILNKNFEDYSNFFPSILAVTKPFEIQSVALWTSFQSGMFFWVLGCWAVWCTPCLSLDEESVLHTGPILSVVFSVLSVALFFNLWCPYQRSFHTLIYTSLNMVHSWNSPLFDKLSILSRSSPVASSDQKTVETSFLPVFVSFCGTPVFRY